MREGKELSGLGVLVAKDLLVRGGYRLGRCRCVKGDRKRNSGKGCDGDDAHGCPLLPENSGSSVYVTGNQDCQHYLEMFLWGPARGSEAGPREPALP